MKEHLKKTKQGIFWSLMNQGGNQIFSLLVTFILARLITPEEFGIIAMIAVFSNFARIFVDFGFSNALVQKKDVTDVDVNTVFFSNLIAGTILSVLFYFSAPIIAQFYNEPSLKIFTQALSPIFILTSISGVNKAISLKKLDFKKITVIGLSSTIIGSVTAIVMGYYNFGVWSILTKLLIEQVIITIMYRVYFPINQKFIFNRQSFMGMVGFGSSVAGDRIVNYWYRNADNLMIGKMIGEGALGIYTKSYGIMLLPLQNISRVIGRVLFPSLSLIQNDLTQIKTIYLRATRMIAFITFPMMAGLFILAEPFVLVAFGVLWVEMIPILKVLSLLGAAQSILTLNGTVFQSVGKADLAFKISLVKAPINILSFYVGIKMGGLLGLSIAYAVVNIIVIVPTFYLMGKQINVGVLEMLKSLSSEFFCTVLMSIIIFLTYTFLPHYSFFVSLLLNTIVGVLTYLALFYLIDRKELHSFLHLLRKI